MPIGAWCSVRAIRWYARFGTAQASLLDLDIAEDVVKQLWAVLAAVLHIGDIAVASSGSEGSKIDPADRALLLSSKLLGINAAAMVKTITTYVHRCVICWELSSAFNKRKPTRAMWCCGAVVLWGAVECCGVLWGAVWCCVC